ncbi:MAG: T9SS type A sorting domain-containing protein [Ignavibacteriae bacterium]|nr:T9SS type A sorting domain-containing protein [Ignavibacteriota bacterium]
MKETILYVKKIFLLFIVFNISVFSQTDSTYLKLISPNGGEYWTVGANPIISWESKNVTLIKIEISYDNGSTWETIVPYAIAANFSNSSWIIPEISSDECLIKLSKFDNNEIFDVSEWPFTITEDSVITKLVVIGSSTAAGIGPSNTDSAWVNRYRKHLVQKNTNVQVINLAVGGYTTYDLMPDGFTPPIGRPTPKISANITKALSYDPKAIIINLPSNDVTQGFAISEQLENYDTILANADAKNIPVWVSTTQPRNLTEVQRLQQMEVRDSTYSKFKNFAIDFWTDLANADGTINSNFDSGDGVHLNDAGHRILFNRVVDEKIYEQAVITSVNKYFEIIPSKFELAQNYPNPFNPTTTIQFSISKESKVVIKIYNILGQFIETLVNENLRAGIHKTVWNASNLAAGPYFYVLQANDYFESKKMLLLK